MVEMLVFFIINKKIKNKNYIQIKKFSSNTGNPYSRLNFGYRNTLNYKKYVLGHIELKKVLLKMDFFKKQNFFIQKSLRYLQPIESLPLIEIYKKNINQLELAGLSYTTISKNIGKYGNLCTYRIPDIENVNVNTLEEVLRLNTGEDFFLDEDLNSIYLENLNRIDHVFNHGSNLKIIDSINLEIVEIVKCDVFLQAFNILPENTNILTSLPFFVT